MNRNYYFYLLLFVSVVALFFTNPFMRYPYDIWEHLITMDSEYVNIINMPESRRIWHSFWSQIFGIIGVENSQIFLRAYIIHIVQTLFALSSIFLFSRVTASILFDSIDRISLNYLAYWSTIVWLTIFATFSIYYHHLWIMWYSVNYQITLPLFWYSLTLVNLLVFMDHSYKIKLFYISMLVTTLYLILVIHPMELLYFIIYSIILASIYIDRVLLYIRRYYIAIISLSVIVGFSFSKIYGDHLPPIVEYLAMEKFPQLYELIEKNGKLLVEDRYNRAFASFNELMVLTLVVGLVSLIIILYRRYRGVESIVNVRLFVGLVVTSMLVLLPIFEFSSGVASIFTNLNVVNRFYYSASIFLLLPASIYYLLRLVTKKSNIMIFNSTIIIILLATILYSRDFTKQKNYYKNIKSLESSFSYKKVGFHLSDEQIKRVGVLLKEYESQRDKSKKVLYLAKGDIAMVLKYIYRKDVYWRGRKTNPTYQDMEDYIRIHQPPDTECIIFRTPNDFPIYEPYR